MPFRKKPFWITLLEYLGIARTVIDIGPDAVRLLTAVPLPGRLRTLDSRECKIGKRGTGAALRDCLEASGIPARTDLSFSGAMITPVCLSLPLLPKDRLASVIRSEMENLLPLPPESVTVLSRLLGKQSSQTARENHLAYCWKREDLSTVLDVLNAGGVFVERISYLPIRTALCSARPFLPGRTGVLYAGTRRLILAVLNNGRLEHFSQSAGNFSAWSAVTIRSVTNYFHDRAVALDRVVAGCAGARKLPPALLKSLEENHGRRIPVLSRNCPEGPDETPDLTHHFSGHAPETAVPATSPVSRRLAVLALRAAFWATTVLNFAVLAGLASGMTEYFSGRQTRNRILNGLPQSLPDNTDSAVRQAAELRRIILEADALESRILQSGRVKLSGQSSGTVTSLILSVSRTLPSAVRLDRLTVSGTRTDADGLALDVGSLEKWVKTIGDDPAYRNVLLDRADMVPHGPSRALQFHIRWETAP